MMNGNGCGWGFVGMGLWGLLGLLAVAAVVGLMVLGGVWLSRRGSRATAGGTAVVGGDSARDRLRQRYADGEVDEEEFERRLAALDR